MQLGRTGAAEDAFWTRNGNGLPGPIGASCCNETVLMQFIRNMGSGANAMQGVDLKLLT